MSHPGPDLEHPAGHATIRHVAELAGVSVKSVSRVVNGEAGVRPELAERVTAAIEQLGYRRNLAASTLRRRGQRTGSIGVVIQDVANPFAATLLRAVEEVAQRRGVVVLASSIDGDAEREARAVAELVRRRVDGMILMPTSAQHGSLAEEQRLGMHVVFVDRPPVGLDADYVGADNAGGARTAVRALLDRGHRRIAYLGDTRTISTAVERLAGYRQAFVDAGVETDEELIVHDLNVSRHARAAAAELLSRRDRPTALFTAQNLITIAALHVLRGLELRQRVAHIGFDDVELGDLLTPGVSVVRQDPTAIGRTAAELLFGRLDGDDGPVRRVIRPVELVERGSGELAPLAFEG